MTETTFKADGREWTIIWTAAVSRRLAALGVTATHPSHLEHLFNLRYDRVKLVDALWACVAGKSADDSDAKEQFEESITGDEIEVAFDAMIAAYVKWQAADLRPLMREAIATYYRGVSEATEETVAEFFTAPAIA